MYTLKPLVVSTLYHSLVIIPEPVLLGFRDSVRRHRNALSHYSHCRLLVDIYLVMRI